ncbi:hypothetical protein, partial [Streptomyces spectabilis]|uniref:hypothetical protein n=1 Tax=Streptomyces spectabilis TaxID=68270 RepID=UPI0033C6B4C8
MLKELPRASLLTYSLRGENGKPINAGEKNNLEFVATNPEPVNGKDAWVSYLALMVKVGDGQDSLCLEKDLKSIKPSFPSVPPAKKFRSGSKKEVIEQAKKQTGWELIAQFESYAYEKVFPYVLVKGGESISFKIPGVMVSPTSGEAPFLVLEYALDVDKKTISYTGSPSLNGTGRFTKMGAGFFFDYLSTDQPEIEKGSAARLVWSAENVKRYVVHAKEQLDIAPDAKAKDTGALTEATAYLVEAFSKENLSYTQQTVAAIHNPSSTFHDVTVKQSLDLSHTAYTKAEKISYSSNVAGDKEIVAPAPVSGHEGDCFAVVGISSVDHYTPAQNKKPGLNLFLVRPGRSDVQVGTLWVDPKQRCAVGLRVPAKAKRARRRSRVYGKGVDQGCPEAPPAPSKGDRS